MAQRSRPTVAGVMADAPPRIKQALLDDPRTDNDTGHHPTPPASQTPAQAQAPISDSRQSTPMHPIHRQARIHHASCSAIYRMWPYVTGVVIGAICAQR